MKDQEITTKNAQETREAAGRFFDQLINESGGKDKAAMGARLVCLWGDLGSGKTTFTQGLAEKLRVRETVNSPTFFIMKKYPALNKGIYSDLYHFDLYRISDKQEILDLGWEEILSDANNIIVVEWPEKILEILPARRIDIRFDAVSEDVRRIAFHFL